MITVSKLIKRIKIEIARFFLNRCYVFQLHNPQGCMKIESDSVMVAWEINQLLRQSKIALSAEQRALYEGRFAKRDALYYIACEDTIIASGWKRPNINSFYAWEIHRDICFDRPVSMLYDFSVDKNHRGKGLYSSMLRAIIARAEFDERLVIFALSDNIGSIKGINRAGFKKWFVISHFFLKREGHQRQNDINM